MLYHETDIRLFRKRRRLLALFFALFLVFSVAFLVKVNLFPKRLALPRTYAEVKAQLREVTVISGNGETVLLLEVADTSEEHAEGLMFRRNLAKNSGMFFVFPEEISKDFWMKNTLLPLDILFVSNDGLIVDMASMIPCKRDPCTVYQSALPYRYAIEVNEGFLRQHRVRRGDRVRFAK